MNICTVSILTLTYSVQILNLFTLINIYESASSISMERNKNLKMQNLIENLSYRILHPLTDIRS